MSNDPTLEMGCYFPLYMLINVLRQGSMSRNEYMRLNWPKWFLLESVLSNLPGLFWLQVYGPSVDSESKLSFFPSVANAIYQSTQVEGGNNATIQHEIWRAARAIQRGADALKGDLISWGKQEMQHIGSFSGTCLASVRRKIWLMYSSFVLFIYFSFLCPS